MVAVASQAARVAMRCRAWGVSTWRSRSAGSASVGRVSLMRDGSWPSRSRSRRHSSASPTLIRSGPYRRRCRLTRPPVRRREHGRRYVDPLPRAHLPVRAGDSRCRLRLAGLRDISGRKTADEAERALGPALYLTASTSRYASTFPSGSSSASVVHRRAPRGGLWRRVSRWEAAAVPTRSARRSDRGTVRGL